MSKGIFFSITLAFGYFFVFRKKSLYNTKKKLCNYTYRRTYKLKELMLSIENDHAGLPHSAAKMWWVIESRWRQWRIRLQAINNSENKIENEIFLWLNKFILYIYTYIQKFWTKFTIYITRRSVHFMLSYYIQDCIILISLKFTILII